MRQRVNETIEELMLEGSHTITSLSKDLGIGYKQLSNYVKGIYVPSLKNAILIADYFNCSLDFLCGLTDLRLKHKYSKPDYLFYERYKQALNNLKISHYKLCKDTGINVNDLRLWKMGRIPTLTTLIKLADYLSNSIDYLIGRNVIKN